MNALHVTRYCTKPGSIVESMVKPTSTVGKDSFERAISDMNGRMVTGIAGRLVTGECITNYSEFLTIQSESQERCEYVRRELEVLLV